MFEVSTWRASHEFFDAQPSKVQTILAPHGVHVTLSLASWVVGCIEYRAIALRLLPPSRVYMSEEKARLARLKR